MQTGINMDFNFPDRAAFLLNGRLGKNLLMFFCMTVLFLGGLGFNNQNQSFGQNTESPKKFIPENLKDADFIKVSSPAQPEAYFAVNEDGNNINIVLKIGNTPGTVKAPHLTLGFSNGKLLTLTNKDARSFKKGNFHYFVFKIPGSSSKTDRFNLAFASDWTGGPYGKPLRKEHYMVDNSSAPHDPIGANPKSWGLVNLAEYRQKLKDLENVIKIEFDQKFGGKATVVIDDVKGNRIRNLASAMETEAGNVSLEWDGLDDNENLIKPGKYQWKVIYHPGIKPKYLMRYADGYNEKWRSFGSNHGHFMQVATDKNYIYLGSPITEGGWAMIAIDENGKWIKGFDQIHGTGYSAVAIAVDDKYFYVAHEGTTPGQDTKTKGTDANPEFEFGINITKYDLETQRPVSFKKGSFVWLDKFKRLKKEKISGLRGMVKLDGLLYISSFYNNSVLVIDPETMEKTGEIRVDKPGSMALNGKNFFIQSGDDIYLLNPKTKTKSLVIKNIRTNGMTYDEKLQLLYVSNAETNQIDIFKDNKKVKSLGVTGGAYQGKFIPGRMVNPCGIGIFKGKLWVTENRRNPKRVLAWDLNSGKVAIQLFGNPAYGGSAAGFDYADSSKFVGLRGLWDINLHNKTADYASIFQKSGKHFGGYYEWAYRYGFHHEAGRNFLVGAGFINTVSELMPDGSLKDLTAESTVGSFRYGCNWHPPESFEEALKKHVAKIDPEQKMKDHEQKSLGVFWRDKNGDGLCQEDEFEFSGKDERISGSRWGHVIYGITYRLPVTVGKKSGIIVMKPDGFDKNGVPNYPSLKQAFAKTVYVGNPVNLGQYKNIMAESLTDRFGNMFVNSTPNMVGLSSEGKMLWFFKNDWVGVHGSHKAPLPQPGQMQGCLFFLGRGKLDDKADVFMLNGNHGPHYALTSDGFYLDQMFRDCRMGGARDDMLIGGECFGGFFNKSEKDGKYYLITGGSGYRIYEIEGLDKIQRVSGSVDVKQEQIIACDRKFKAKQREKIKTEAAVGVAMYLDKTPKIDAGDRDWPKKNYISWDAGVFKPQVRIGWDRENLYLYYKVQDDSPWVNNGKDWQSLFKTGDSIDFQIGTDRSADPRRKSPVPGDIRLLIAPYGDTNIAVLYRHRVKVKNAKNNPVKFTSPMWSETVEDVKRLDNAKIAVKKTDKDFTVEAAILLSELGLKPGTQPFRADIGVIFGDNEGTINLLRSYWSNKATALVNDVPSEIKLNPDLWGTVKFEGEN